MLFNSWLFAIFITVLLGMFIACPGRYRKLLLLGASYIFYGAWNYLYTPLLLYSSVLNYYLARMINNAHAQSRNSAAKVYLALSVAGSLAVLFFFKYANLFSASAQSLLAAFGLDVSIPTLNLLLPIGISFFTFQSMSYTIDVYRGKIEPARKLSDFMLFISFFPQLVAGPIVRANEFLPQLENFEKKISKDYVKIALMLMMTGFFKKMVMADNLARFVDPLFDNPDAANSSLNIYFTIQAYAFQIYFDFSGYTDIARGIAMLFGFDLPLNFRQPYFSRNPSEFWRRWHITLSTWLRDYLYISLGGNRVSKLKTQVNLMITMLLGGLWHGANWTFVAWGAIHGLFLLVSRPFKDFSKSPRWVQLSGWFVTLHIVLFAWIFFRAESFSDAFVVISTLFAASNLTWNVNVVLLIFIAICWLYHGIEHLVDAKSDAVCQWWIIKAPVWLETCVYFSIFMLLIIFRSEIKQFVYFQF